MSSTERMEMWASAISLVLTEFFVVSSLVNNCKQCESGRKWRVSERAINLSVLSIIHSKLASCRFAAGGPRVRFKMDVDPALCRGYGTKKNGIVCMHRRRFRDYKRSSSRARGVVRRKRSSEHCLKVIELLSSLDWSQRSRYRPTISPLHRSPDPSNPAYIKRKEKEHGR